jgi:hypothetical protein
MHAWCAFNCQLIGHHPVPTHPRRPTVKGVDDCSNFDDYSELEPMAHAFALSNAEQALFNGF